MDAPLAGVRVVEVANFVAVPAAGALLADLGADVVKVELPAGEIYPGTTRSSRRIRRSTWTTRASVRCHSI
ncbi:MAG: CoA transferase [Myxococcota bacterium]